MGKEKAGTFIFRKHWQSPSFTEESLVPLYCQRKKIYLKFTKIWFLALGSLHMLTTAESILVKLPWYLACNEQARMWPVIAAS